MIVAIDGPAGSGKTTVAKLLAQKLGILYLDTGAIYRALTYKALKENVDLDDEERLEELAGSLRLSFDFSRGKIFLHGEDITEKIREPIIDKSISKVAEKPKVRRILVKLQREIAQGRDFVVEGRDITTVVFPKAEFKFFLDAQFSIRLKRRFKELVRRKVSISREEVEEDLRRRDKADLERKEGPLKKSDDAIYIDTTNLSIEEVVEKLLGYICKKERK
ncbi:MAG: cytidylate kinase [Candidatus Omnitrophica bacterium 4484_70.1]|nr:MAG: cytidylate kinase [Candidatus Omnitrophica bacterium 4484_70.1]